MKRIVLLTAIALLALGAVGVQAEEYASVTEAAANMQQGPGGPPLGAQGDVQEFFATAYGAPMCLDYDYSRGGVWMTTENGHLVLYSAATGAVIRDIDLTGVTLGSTGGNDGFQNGICVLANGNLLLSDFNGDLTNIDDHLFELNPDTVTIVNYWPLDGIWNTSTDASKVDAVLGHEVDPCTGLCYVTCGWDNTIYEIELVTDGNPGTWRTVSTIAAPVVGDITGIDYVSCVDWGSGWMIGDWDSTTVALLDENFNAVDNFAAVYNGSTYNFGVTLVLTKGINPMTMWACNWGNDNIGILDTGITCDCQMAENPDMELRAWQRNYKNVVLKWKDDYNNESGYVVQRQTGYYTGVWETVANLPANTTKYKDTKLAPNYYTYRIVVDLDGCHFCTSPFSNKAYQTTKKKPPRR